MPARYCSQTASRMNFPGCGRTGIVCRTRWSCRRSRCRPRPAGGHRNCRRRRSGRPAPSSPAGSRPLCADRPGAPGRPASRPWTSRSCGCTARSLPRVPPGVRSALGRATLRRTVRRNAPSLAGLWCHRRRSRRGSVRRRWHRSEDSVGPGVRPGARPAGSASARRSAGSARTTLVANCFCTVRSSPG